MTSNITPDRVQIFQIDGRCMNKFPCVHFCTLTLFDGRVKEIDLGGDEIHAFINVIAEEKIVGHDPHFDDYKSFVQFLPGKRRPNYFRPIPEEILTNIFKKPRLPRPGSIQITK